MSRAVTLKWAPLATHKKESLRKMCQVSQAFPKDKCSPRRPRGDSENGWELPFGAGEGPDGVPARATWELRPPLGALGCLNSRQHGSCLSGPVTNHMSVCVYIIQGDRSGGLTEDKRNPAKAGPCLLCLFTTWGRSRPGHVCEGRWGVNVSCVGGVETLISGKGARSPEATGSCLPLSPLLLNDSGRVP